MELERFGLEWLTEFKPYLVEVHLHAINNHRADVSFSTRVKFLELAIRRDGLLERYDELYHEFLGANDYDWAALCAAAVYGNIWESGDHFARFDSWRRKAENLMGEGRLSPAVHCFLLLQHCWAEVAGRGDISKVFKNLTVLRDLAEQTRSPDCILMTSALAAYVYCWRGDLAAYEIIVSDSEPYLHKKNISPISSLQFLVSKGLFLTLQGNHNQAEVLFVSLLDSPMIEQLPPSIWLMIHSHYLHCLVSQNKQKNIEEIAEKIRNKAIPEANHYYHSYLHFNLGVAALALGRPHKALLHSKEAIRRGEFCQSTTCLRMPALLYGQALADLESFDDAISHFQVWLPKWEQADFLLIASLAYLEIAAVYKKRGKAVQQSVFFKKAHDRLPEKNRLCVMYRPPSFVKSLEETSEKISSASLIRVKEGIAKPLQFKTFGSFSIEWQGKTLDEAIWKGKQARRLLQVLITLGGVNVPCMSVADILWPESDGDRALNSLKVTISRLRKTVHDYIEADWLQVKRQTISLSLALCQVDYCNFEEGLKRSLSNGTDIELLKKTLKLYTGNYLEHETTESWAMQKKDVMRGKYLEGVFALQKYCMNSGDIDTAFAYLKKALQYDSANEAIYERLMDCCIAQGRRAKALEYFNLAHNTLVRDFGIQPGEKLRMLEKIAKEQG